MSVLQLDQIAKIIAESKRAKLAAILGVSRSTVSGWANQGRRARGMCGTIPEKYWPQILATAKAKGVEITLSDLMPNKSE